MNLKQLKNSMLFKACAYREQVISMEKFHAINQGDKRAPEKDIISFYLSFHIIAVAEQKYGIENELPEDVAALVKVHHEQMEEVFFRIFTYLMLISIGESRHGSLKTTQTQNKYGDEVADFAKSIKGGQRSSARYKFVQEQRNLHKFMRYCDWMFIECFGGGSYGGPKWKNISNKVTQVLKGEISPFTMTDVAWALVHNTGSIFNKNTIYTTESSNLTQLLDFQRGGAIPSLIKNRSKYVEDCSHLNVPGGMLTQFEADLDAASTILGEDLGAYVPPADIAAAGALSSAFPANATGGDDVADGDLVAAGEMLNFGAVKMKKLKRKGA